MSEQENVIVLTDEEGTEHEFEVVDMVQVDGNEYAILQPLDDEEDEAIILKLDKDEDGNDVLIDIEDDEEWEKVADYWQEQVEQLDDEEDEN